MGKTKWIDDRFRKALSRLRDRDGLTQAQLAAELEHRGLSMHWTTVAKIEKGDRSVRIDEAAAIADVFNVSVDALLGRSAPAGTDFMHALRGVLDAKEQARQAVSVHQRMLSEAADSLAGVDTTGRYAELVADCEAACNVLDRAEQALAAIGDNLSPRAAAALRKGTEKLLRAWLAEQRSDDDDEA
jgi:transcriptional regulator with XRE-family HTH domain